MATASLTSLSLTRFKSFKDAVLPIGPLTVLTGRNSGGKSNALDALDVLSRLAGGEELADALDGRRREGGPVRGGSRGCAPHGESSFALGCTVSLGTQTYSLNVVVQVEPELRVISEELVGPAPTVDTGKIERRVLFATRRPLSSSAVIEVEIFNGKRGLNPSKSFRDTRLIASQIPARIVSLNRADAAVLRAAQAVTAALRGAFHLDPVPHLMRDYVPELDTGLRRTAENLSAAVGRLIREDEGAFLRLEGLARDIAGEPVRGLTVITSSLGDVMLALKEGDGPEVTPAREMSDGLLRFLAIAAALLTANRGLDIDPGLTTPGEVEGGVELVLEELENGLHPAQADRVLRLINEATSNPGTRVMLTTHSPALLNALPGGQVRNVIVCYREKDDGHSQVKRLSELPNFAAAMAAGRLGDVVSEGELVEPRDTSNDYSEFRRLLGME